MTEHEKALRNIRILAKTALKTNEIAALHKHMEMVIIIADKALKSEDGTNKKAAAST